MAPLKSLRSQYGSAGNKDDRFDAYVLADTLRTDGHRWRPLREDGPQTKALRALCRSRKDLVETRVQILNQVRANLELAFPGGIGLFSKANSPTTIAFLLRFPTADKAAWLSPKRLANWLASVGYTGGIPATELHRRLQRAAPGLAGQEGEARGAITLALIAMLVTLNEQIAVLEDQMGELFAAHPDQHIFSNLPRSGTVRAASLLAEIGDCRERFDRRRPGCTGRCIAVDEAIRKDGASSVPLVMQQEVARSVMDFANGSRAGDPWAAAIYSQAIRRGCRHPHAVRVLARVWLRVIWRCWQDGVAFDPGLHGARHRIAA